MKTIAINVPCNSFFEAHLPMLPSSLNSIVRKNGQDEITYQFISTHDYIECDVCVVFITAPEAFQYKWEFKCAPQNVIAFCSESQYNYPTCSRAYLSQFGLVWTNQSLSTHLHPNVLLAKIPNNPFVCSTIGLENKEVPQALRDYNFFKSNATFPKTREISIIASTNTGMKGHKDRFEFAVVLKKHFGDRLDFYGRGVHPIHDKFEVVSKYKYHIAIENASCNHYISEKLEDSFLCLAHPFYFGAPNVGEYYPQGSYTGIDIYNVKRSIKIIENAMRSNVYEENFSKLALSKELVLEKYNFFNQIIDICENKLNLDATKEIITIRPRASKYLWRVRKALRHGLYMMQGRKNIKDFIVKNVE